LIIAKYDNGAIASANVVIRGARNDGGLNEVMLENHAFGGNEVERFDSKNVGTDILNEKWKEWQKFGVRARVHVGEESFLITFPRPFWKEPTAEVLRAIKSDFKGQFGRKRKTTLFDGDKKKHVTFSGKHVVGEPYVEAIQKSEGSDE
jgi:hypothetical protein